MSEFRQDIVNKNWVLIAQGRAKRPEDFKPISATPANLPNVSGDCQFCPGNEQETSGEINAYPDADQWQVRVIPNKYEAVSHTLGRSSQAFYATRAGVGDHEVIITRPHDLPLALQEVELIDLVLRVYIDRISDLKSHSEVRYIQIIQNHGMLAGASLIHPHSQIFAMPFLPDRIQNELSGARGYLSLHNVCVYCQIIEHELGTKQRLVMENKDYVVLAPFASKMAFELHIIPKKHDCSFENITISQRKILAETLKDIFSRLYQRMKNPAYNYYIHTAPFGGETASKTHDDRKSYHWHMVILPRINIWAGFELGTEVYINPIPPEQVAKFLN